MAKKHTFVVAMIEQVVFANPDKAITINCHLFDRLVRDLNTSGCLVRTDCTAFWWHSTKIMRGEENG